MTDKKRKFNDIFSEEAAIEMKKRMNMVKENNCTIPSLQLSLRPASLCNDEKDVGQTEEADSMLSLSLSPPVCREQASQSSTMHDMTKKHEIQFLQTLAEMRPLRG